MGVPCELYLYPADRIPINVKVICVRSKSSTVMENRMLTDIVHVAKHAAE